MYKFRVVEHHKFLTGHMAGMTVEGGFPICALTDYNVDAEVGKVRTSCGTKSKYRVVAARIVEL